MKLEDLYPNFGRSSPEDQAKFVADYRLRRAQDLERLPTTKKKSTTKVKKEGLSEEEKMLAKLLGISQKDMLALRVVEEAVVEEEEKAEDESVLFQEDSYEEGGEE